MEIEDGHTRITLRIPKDLHAQMAKEAEERSTSLNAVIIERLRKPTSINISFGDDVPPEAVNSGMQEIAKALKKLGGDLKASSESYLPAQKKPKR